MTKSSKDERRLCDILQQLPASQAQALLDYAEFLLARYGAAPVAVIEPPLPDMPRPSNESVVAAIKRLRASYPMLDAAKLLNETSELMSQHVLRGRAAAEVIDALEQLFRRHFDNYQAGRSG